jgi:hypothetical protein
MLSSDNGGNVSVNGKSYLFQPNEHLIVIPADGFYKIDMTVETNLLSSQKITASQKVHEASGEILKPDVVEKDVDADILDNNVEQYAGIIVNLFKDPLTKSTAYNEMYIKEFGKKAEPAKDKEPETKK